MSEVLISTSFRITESELREFKALCPEGKYGITLRALIKQYIKENKK